MSSFNMNIKEIFEYLPHRSPFLLIDKIVDFESKKSLTAIKNVTFNEPFFQGHFPDNPIMPGVLIIESLAKAYTVFSFLSTKRRNNGDVLYLFAGIDKARFKRVVEPGDQLKLEIELIQAREKIWKVKGTATVEGQVACIAELMSVKRE